MRPILISFGPIIVQSYAVMLVAAFLGGTWLAGKQAERLPRELAALNASQVFDLTSISLIGGLIGGRVFYLSLYWDIFRRHPQEILAFWHGGLVWYGGLIGSVFAGWVYVRVKRLSALRVADHMAPFMAVGHAIGRLGCFMQGCCYGKETTAWWAVKFPGHAQRLIPTQLIEMAGLLALYALLYRWQQPATLRHPGRLSGLYLVCYALLRWAVEALRGDQSIWWAGLTLQQIVSGGVALAGLALIAWSLRASTLK